MRSWKVIVGVAVCCASLCTQVNAKRPKRADPLAKIKKQLKSADAEVRSTALAELERMSHVSDNTNHWSTFRPAYDAMSLLLNVHSASGGKDKALAVMSRMRELLGRSAKNTAYMSAFVLQCVQLGYKDEALEMVESIVKTLPKAKGNKQVVQMCMVLGDLREGEKEFAAAAQAYLRSARAASANAKGGWKPYESAIRCLAACGDVDGALVAAKEGAALFPGQARAGDVVGLARE